MPSLFPCSPVIREYSWKKTRIEKNIYSFVEIGICLMSITVSISTKAVKFFLCLGEIVELVETSGMLVEIIIETI